MTLIAHMRSSRARRHLVDARLESTTPALLTSPSRRPKPSSTAANIASDVCLVADIAFDRDRLAAGRRDLGDQRLGARRHWRHS